MDRENRGAVGWSDIFWTFPGRTRAIRQFLAGFADWRDDLFSQPVGDRARPCAPRPYGSRHRRAPATDRLGIPAGQRVGKRTESREGSFGGAGAAGWVEISGHGLADRAVSWTRDPR